ncbi:pyruvate dehydrogenase E1 component alpha subunit [Limimonas halophila]|uniref:Pyruvate dehydrogenase E1 component subunit alpha n=1 Tax=Limimonas halophila TaxID=1082479 RepID=A0A1G7NBR9_9PROT|nr:pyruvate dehydrogenase (acetyl-transferring) E1 component subunit alpha [Limimonas halophila]SDF71371.1 pyruvate dehydrogenase E1 component alpha subunit [Limimonas halophila]
MATKKGGSSAASNKAAETKAAGTDSRGQTGGGSGLESDPTFGLSKDRLLELYREMLLIRRFEEKAGQLYGMGLIGGFCHLYIGQEAVVSGVKAVTREDDPVVASYRCHGHMLASGMEARRVMAELTGREAGYSKGKGGSMHMFSVEKDFYGGHGIVGAQVPVGTGVAFALKYNRQDNICPTYLGDGAINQGQVYESFNMAELWQLPVLYIIENNKYGMGTSVERASSTTELYTRGKSFNIPGEPVDGMHVLSVMEAAQRAAEFVRNGNGPYILEMQTYRYRGHSMSDPAKYRSREEVQHMRQERDPLLQLREVLETHCGVEEDELKQLDREIKDHVSEAAEFAQNSEEPDPEELFSDVVLPG